MKAEIFWEAREASSVDAGIVARVFPPCAEFFEAIQTNSSVIGCKSDCSLTRVCISESKCALSVEDLATCALLGRTRPSVLRTRNLLPDPGESWDRDTPYSVAFEHDRDYL